MSDQDLTDALDALESMVEQFLWTRDGIHFDHYFMAAGEHASVVLARLRPDLWALTPSGLVTRRRREPLPAGGHTPQHITPDPQAVRIPRPRTRRTTQQEQGGQVTTAHTEPGEHWFDLYLMDHTERDDLATEINRRTQA